MENNLLYDLIDLQRRQLAAQETANAHLALIAANTRPLASHELLVRRKIYREEAIDKLGISDSTYKRRVADGILKPRGLSHDFFYPEDLEKALSESRRKGKI